MGMDLIEAKTAPTSNVFTFTGYSFAAYDYIGIALNSIVMDTDDTEIIIQARTGGSLINGASDYAYASVTNTSGGTTTQLVSANDTGVILCDTSANFGIGNAAGEALGGRIEILMPNGTVYPTICYTMAYTNNSGNFNRTQGSAVVRTTSALDGFTISGRGVTLITSGTAALFGFRA